MACHWKIVVESEGKRLFELWNEGLQEVGLGAVRVIVEEKAADRSEVQPLHVEESKRQPELGCASGPRRNPAGFKHYGCHISDDSDLDLRICV